ncbi:MAG: hypothetical protein U9Q82_03375 [Chloroflexota bacterium]|nr:hypothetical protein [Chloroflexota bacterium]
MNETPAIDKVLKQINEDDEINDDDLNAALDEVDAIVAELQ